MLAFLLLLLLSSFALSAHSSTFVPSSATFIRTTTHHVGDEPWQHYNQSEYTFDAALIDHFNLSSQATYSQRYFTVDHFAHNSSSPVLYLLCGEYTCPGVNPARLFPLQLAYEFGAFVVAIEHRFYGDSYPTPPTTDQLGLLNSRQALNDFAWYKHINTYNSTYPPLAASCLCRSPTLTHAYTALLCLRFQHFYQSAVLNAQQPAATSNNRWFVIGGSYPGALSAWYRLKYPHLVVGSIASSAVVEAVLDFPEFDEQVERSAGPDCAAALRNITALVEAAMPAVEEEFGCPASMNDGDFLFMIADSAVEGVQYGGRIKLCDYVAPHYRLLVEATTKAAVARSLQSRSRVVDAVSDAVVSASVRLAERDLLQSFVNYTNEVFFGEQGNSCEGYDRRHWMDTSRGNADRSWGWQSNTATHSAHSTTPTPGHSPPHC